MAWLIDSAAAGYPLAEEQYIIRSSDAESRYGFKMDEAIVDKRKCLTGLSVFCTEVPKQVKVPPPADMRLIVESAGEFLSYLQSNSTVKVVYITFTTSFFIL